MVLQPITEGGEVVDYFDDGQTAPTENDEAQKLSPAAGSSSPAAQQDPTAPAPAAVFPTAQPGTHHEAEQEAKGTPEPQTAPAVKVQKEDTTDFDASDVKIEIMLHRADGDAQGRLVSVIIHNFSGTPMTQDFREVDLSDKARLDSIHRAIYPVMQRFLLDLSARRQKKLEEEARRAPKPAPLPSQAPAPKPSAASAAPAPTAKPVLPAAANQAAAANEGGKKKEAGKQQGKYQPIPLF